MTTATVSHERGRFLRRAAALAIDVVLATIVVVALGLLADALTDGRVRLSETHFFEKDECSRPDRVYEGLKLPEGFRPTSTSRCVSRFLGYAYDWVLIVDERTEIGTLHF